MLALRGAPRLVEVCLSPCEQNETIPIAQATTGGLRGVRLVMLRLMSCWPQWSAECCWKTVC